MLKINNVNKRGEMKLNQAGRREGSDDSRTQSAGSAVVVSGDISSIIWRDFHLFLTVIFVECC